MSREVNEIESRITKLEEEKSYINIPKLEKCIASLQAFSDSRLGKMMREFCEEYSNGNFNKTTLKKIEILCRSKKENPFGFEVDHDEPVKGEKLLYGEKFTSNHDDFSPMGWFVYYMWDNFDLDKDIARIQKRLEENLKELPELEAEIADMKKEKAKYKPMSMSLCEGRHNIPEAKDGSIFPNTINDPTDLYFLYRQAEEKLKYADSLTLYVTGMTPALIETIKVCVDEGIPLTLMHYNAKTGNYFKQDYPINVYYDNNEDY